MLPGNYHVRKSSVGIEVGFFCVFFGIYIPIIYAIFDHSFSYPAIPHHNTNYRLQGMLDANPILFLTYFMSLLPNREIVSSSHQITLFHCYDVRLTWVLDYFNLFNFCWRNKNGFFREILGFRPICAEQSFHSTPHSLVQFRLVYIQFL